MPEETRGIDPYDAVLSDLRAKRDQIDQAIAAIESIRGGTGAALNGLAAAGAGGPPLVPPEGPGALLGMSIVDATKKLLASKRTTLKNPEIATLFKAGGLHLNSKDWANTIGAVMTRRFEEVGDVVKVDRGTWGLKEWYPNRSFKKAEAASESESATENEKGEAEEQAAPQRAKSPFKPPEGIKRRM